MAKYHEVCAECGEDWEAGQRRCSHCGGVDHESEHGSDSELRRSGGLDLDA
jgi:hypothetical protein